MNSQSVSSYTIHFYSNVSCDPSGYGEGQVYLGSFDLTTDSNGMDSFSRVLSVAQKYLFITATATDVDWDTSEFSAYRSASTVYLPLVSR